MDFLQKKGFHPGTFKNMEKVWLREQAAKKEEENIKELQRQIEEERNREETQRIYTGSVHGQKAGAKGPNGLEWMYSAPVQADKKEEYLMGKKYEADKPDLRAELSKTGFEKSSLSSTPSASDDWSKLHNDPLMAIKMQEKSALDAIRNNPVKMARLKQALGIADGDDDKKKKKKKKKKDKKDKKEKKDKKDKKDKKKRERSPEKPAVAPPPSLPGFGLQFPGGKPPPQIMAPAPASSLDASKKDSKIEDLKRKDKKPKLSEEEKAALRAQMMRDGEDAAAERGARVQKAVEEERAEKEEPKEGQASFVRDMNKKVFIEEDLSLAERMQRTRHTRQKATDNE